MTGALVGTDRHTGLPFNVSGSTAGTTGRISEAGSGYATGGFVAALYLIGRSEGNAHLRETGLLAGEALIDTGILAQGLKVITQRPRPTTDDHSGEFYDKGSSFPSGHAISAWSVATVVAYEYGDDKPWVKFLAYGTAATVSIACYTSGNHYLSDVFVGSALGYGVGRFVYKRRHNRNLDKAGNGITGLRLIPDFEPIYNSQARLYGAHFSWSM